MDEARSVTATFTTATYALTVTLAGAGSGSVSSSPPGSTAVWTAREDCNHGTLVTLTATPSVGSVFGG